MALVEKTGTWDSPTKTRRFARQIISVGLIVFLALAILIYRGDGTTSEGSRAFLVFCLLVFSILFLVRWVIRPGDPRVYWVEKPEENRWIVTHYLPAHTTGWVFGIPMFGRDRRIVAYWGSGQCHASLENGKVSYISSQAGESMPPIPVAAILEKLTALPLFLAINGGQQVLVTGFGQESDRLSLLFSDGDQFLEFIKTIPLDTTNSGLVEFEDNQARWLALRQKAVALVTHVHASRGVECTIPPDAEKSFLELAGVYSLMWHKLGVHLLNSPFPNGTPKHVTAPLRQLFTDQQAGNQVVSALSPIMEAVSAYGRPNRTINLIRAMATVTLDERMEDRCDLRAKWGITPHSVAEAKKLLEPDQPQPTPAVET